MSVWVLAATLCTSALAADERGADPQSMAAAARSALADVTRRYGPEVRLLSVEIHRDEVLIDVQDPADPLHVDRHRYEGGRHVGPPEPVPVGRHLGSLRRRVFPAAAVDVSLLPGLLEAAPAHVRAEDGKPTHVVLDREEGDSSWGDPRWRVHVMGARVGGSVEYGLDGKRKRVYRW